MLEWKTQHLLRPAMKANVFLLFVSPLSFLFNTWNPALEDLDLTMSKPPVVEHVPSFLLAQVQVHLLFFAKNYCSEPDWDLRHGTKRRPSRRWMNHCINSLICVSEISIFPVLLFWVYIMPSVSCDLLFLHRKLLLGKSLE